MKKEHSSSAGVRDGVRRKNHVILQEEKYASGSRRDSDRNPQLAM
jgi:hypothetical protein